MDKVDVGDVVICQNGRDKNSLFLVVNVDGNFAYLVNGSKRKVNNPKKKNLKHIKMVESAVDISLAEKIKEGLPVSDKRVRRSLVSVKEKFRR